MIKKQLSNLNESFVTMSMHVSSTVARVNKTLKNQHGNEWIDFGLKILLISLPLAIAGIALCNAIDSKYDSLISVLNTVPIPSLEN